MKTGGEIEFLDTVVVPELLKSEIVDRNSSSWRWLALGAVLLGGGWFITSTGTGSADEGPAAAASSVEDMPPIQQEAVRRELAPRDGAAVAALSFDAWPSPPTERDPNVARVPGRAPLPEELSVHAFRSTTIVYVSTAGLPTVVSFETGDVAVVEVAATRVHETFAVQAGDVVPVESTEQDRAEEGRAIVFHTYRDVDRPGVGTSDRLGVGQGPQLCLSGETCARPGVGLERQRQDGLVAERFDPQRHPQLNDLLSRWDSVDGFLISADGYRMPEPNGLIWVIGPTRSGSVSSSGLL